MREQTPPIATSGAMRRSTRIAHTVALVVTWVDKRSGPVVEEVATVSISCHGFRYFARQRPQKNTSLTFHITENNEDNSTALQTYPGRVAWVRKSHRLEGLFLVGIEFGIPLNIWNVEEVPEDWAAFSPPSKEDPAAFLAEIDRILHFVQTATYYQLLDVEPNTPRSQVKRRFYQTRSTIPSGSSHGPPGMDASLVSGDGRPDDGLQDLVGRQIKKGIRFAPQRQAT